MHSHLLEIMSFFVSVGVFFIVYRYLRIKFKIAYFNDGLKLAILILALLVICIIIVNLLSPLIHNKTLHSLMLYIVDGVILGTLGLVDVKKLEDGKKRKT